MSDSRNSRNEERPPDESSRGNKRDGDGGSEQIPIWEWAVAFFGLVLVIGAVGFMVYSALKSSSQPDVVIRRNSTIPAGEGYLVEIRVVNRGGATVAGLNVEGELRENGKTVEISEATVDYVPPHSEREAGLFFKENPEEFELKLRAEGYEKP